MKKIVAFFVLTVLCAPANLQAFAQKTKNSELRRQPLKNEKPALKTDAPTDVKLQSAEAFSEKGGGGVYLRWQTEHEALNLGYHLYREDKNGRTPVSESFIGGGRTRSSEDVLYGEVYSYFDAEGTPDSIYFIESLQLNGNRQIIGQAAPVSIDDLAAVAGASAAELVRRRRDETNSVIETSSVILPKQLQEQIETNARQPDLATQRWVAAQPGVKLGVKQEGLYRVSRAELASAGFDVSAPGNLWQLYADGNEQSIIVGANDSYIEFYGKGIDTPETDTKFYYLIAGAGNGLRMNATILRPLSGNVTGKSYFQTFERKERKIYLFADILNGEAENFFGDAAIAGSNLPTPPTVTYTFNLSSIDFTVATAFLEISIQGITRMPHQIVPTINGETLSVITGSNFNLTTGSFQIPTSFLREGSNTLQLRSTGGSGDTNLVESIRVSYQRKFEAAQNRLSFYTSNYRQTAVSGFSSPNIRVFDLTYPENPALLANLPVQNNGGNYSITIPSNRGRALFAIEDTAISTVASLTPNIPSTLSIPARNGELIVVSYKDWMTQAEDWANYRRAEGMTVEVVNIEDVYDEFGYGSPSTAAITQFFQYAKNSWQTAPNYVLLLGDTSYDPRNYENRPFQNFILTKRVDTVYEETGSDEALCDFNNDGLAELAVGRIPARNAAHVALAFNKTLAFESTLAGAFSRGALFASDLPVGFDFEGLNQRVAAQLPPSIPKTFLNRGQADSRNLLLGHLNQGPYLINYSGHGAPGSWEGSWLTLNDPATFTNAPNYSLYFMLTCLNGYFMRTDFDSLSEALLKSPNGGGAAVWASTGKTTPNLQETLATRFYNQLNVGSTNRLGALINDAKQNLQGGRDVRLSWALLGDPTLKIKP